MPAKYWIRSTRQVMHTAAHTKKSTGITQRCGLRGGLRPDGGVWGALRLGGGGGGGGAALRRGGVCPDCVYLCVECAGGS